MTEQFGFFPSHDEAARQSFVGALKLFINFSVEPKLQSLFENELTPEFEKQNNTPLNSRESAQAILEEHPLYQFWASMTFHSQTLMWDAVEETSERTTDSQIGLFQKFADNPNKLGSLTLASAPVLKAPVKTTEIHRQPGGYWRERKLDDLNQALIYTGSAELYRNAKGVGLSKTHRTDAMGRFITSIAQKYVPDLDPSAILDMGCGTCEGTLGYKRLFPEATVTGIDVSRPFVRYGHALAESEELSLNLYEMDAGDTTFEDESFDFITSTIVFHETSTAQVRDILKECRRLLKPGGLALHLDVPYQPHRIDLFRQVTNHWQVRNNGEPFWTGFAELDMMQELVDAGFDPDLAFANYETVGSGEFLLFGARKTK